MSFGIKVNGGTGAGIRRVKLRPSWICSCATEHRGDAYSCPDCGERRPE